MLKNERAIGTHPFHVIKGAKSLIQKTDFSKGGKALISEMSDRVIIRNISCCASKPVRRE